jgi:hypothetical protein
MVAVIDWVEFYGHGKHIPTHCQIPEPIHMKEILMWAELDLHHRTPKFRPRT